MSPPILVTSFDVWRADQPSNASDDLLDLVLQQPAAAHVEVLRHLPVNTPVAFAAITEAIAHLSPQYILCCGMAESRHHLNLEAQARCDTALLTTSLDLLSLCQHLPFTHISYDAGTFVCNELYYELLAHLRDRRSPAHGLFVHVPILTADNTAPLVADFCQLLTQLLAAGGWMQSCQSP